MSFGSRSDCVHKIRRRAATIRVNRGNVRKLIKMATAGLFYLPKQVLQRV